jgi:hypothetical protein
MRKKLSRSRSRKIYRKGLKRKKKNRVKIMRGGYRL